MSVEESICALLTVNTSSIQGNRRKWNQKNITNSADLYLQPLMIFFHLQSISHRKILSGIDLMRRETLLIVNFMPKLQT